MSGLRQLYRYAIATKAILLVKGGDAEMPRFGEIIKQARKRNTLTQVKLAKSYGVDEDTIKRWERLDTASEITAIRACRCAGITLEEVEGLYEKPEFKTDFARRLWEQRTRQLTTVKEMAERLKEEPGALNRWERGENLPSTEKAEKVVKGYGIAVHELFTGEAVPVVPYENNYCAWIGLRLARAREEAELTQLEVEKQSGVKYGTQSQYETGLRVPRLEILHELAKLYNKTVDEFLQADVQEDFAKAVRRISGGGLETLSLRTGASGNAIEAWFRNGSIPNIIIARNIADAYNASLEELATNRPSYVYDLIVPEQIRSGEIGKRAKNEIEKRNENESDFLESIGCDARMFQRWRKGVLPNFATVVKVCRHLGITTDELLSTCYWEDRT